MDGSQWNVNTCFTNIFKSWTGVNDIQSRVDKMARWSILVLVLVSLFQTGNSQDVEASCPIINVRKQIMELLVDHNTKLTNLIANMTSSELCQSGTATESTAEVDSVTRTLRTIEVPDNTTSNSTTADISLDGALDCLDIRNKGVTVTGVYNITLGGSTLTRVYCDMDTDGGGWTVFQRRIDGDVDFYLGWNGYKVGFGDVADEFWLGNDNIYILTSLGETEMRIELEDFENNTAYADYSSFWVGDEQTNYKLHVSGFSGSIGNALAYHNGSAFTTKDKDNDEYANNCATLFTGAWWYKSCHGTNLNGQYLAGNTTLYAKGITWASWKGQYYSLKQTKMMARRTTVDGQDER